jgi:hypothetical protein
MMIVVAAISLFVLLSVALHLYLIGVLRTSYPRAFQFALYLLLISFALTIGLGIFHDRSATTPLSVSKSLPEP